MNNNVLCRLITTEIQLKMNNDETIRRNISNEIGLGKPFRILSIQGGGVRGIIPSMILVKLEQITGRHATELFDLFIGTSTGAMICSVLNTPAPQDENELENGQTPWKYSAKDLLDVYIKEGAITFESSMWRKMTTINGLYGPMYHTKNRDERFKAWIGDLRLKDTLTDIILTSYDMCKQAPVFFKTRKAKYKEDDDYLLIDCIKAATAAPTIWPPHPIGKGLYIDALYGKNPALFAVTEATKHYGVPLNKIKLLSLGTGFMRKEEEAHKIATTGPAFLMEVFNSTINANTMSTTYMLQQLLQGESEILDLDPPLAESHMGICDISKSNVTYLIKTTQEYLALHEDELISFARMLLPESEWRKSSESIPETIPETIPENIIQSVSPDLQQTEPIVEPLVKREVENNV